VFKTAETDGGWSLNATSNKTVMQCENPFYSGVTELDIIKTDLFPMNSAYFNNFEINIQYCCHLPPFKLRNRNLLTTVALLSNDVHISSPISPCPDNVLNDPRVSWYLPSAKKREEEDDEDEEDVDSGCISASGVTQNVNNEILCPPVEPKIKCTKVHEQLTINYGGDSRCPAFCAEALAKELQCFSHCDGFSNIPPLYSRHIWNNPENPIYSTCDRDGIFGYSCLCTFTECAPATYGCD